MPPSQPRMPLSLLLALRLALAASLAAAAPAPGAWVHPGVLVSRSQLAFVRAQVSARAEPFWGQWSKFLRTWQSTDAARYPLGPPLSGTIECGSYSVPNHGCSDESKDGVVAYMQALQWAISGNATSAAAAARILDAYVRGLRRYNNSNAPLQCAWSALKFARAGEILRHTGAPWPEADALAFGRWQAAVQLPLIYAGSGSNGNWEASMIEAMIGIATFAENATLFDRAVAMWRQRAPAYLYLHAVDRGVPVPPPRGSATWYGQSVFNAATSGISQETCRDMGHAGMGVASLVNAAETAWIQGVPLFVEQAARLVAGLEFNTPLMASNASVPPALRPLLCGGAGVLAGQPPLGEVALNMFARRLGLSLPATAAYAALVRGKANPSDSLIMQWEPLTHGDDWNATPANVAAAVAPAAWATMTPTGSRSGTPSGTPPPSPSLSPGAPPSASPSPAATGTVWTARFQAGALVVLRGGTPGGASVSTALAHPLVVVETDARTGEARAVTPLATGGGGGPACTLGFSSAGYQLEGFLQRSYDGAVVGIPCNDVPAGAPQPTNVTARVVAVLRADGSVDYSTRVTNVFRDSTSTTQFRTVASLDGSGYWLTGSTTSAASAGLYYIPLGGTQGAEVAGGSNAGNQRYVHVGPAPTSGGGVAPRLFLSFRDPLSARGVAAVGGGGGGGGDSPPTTGANVTTPLLPGFAPAYQAAATAANTSLIGSFVFEPSGVTLWACDTQAWQAGVTPALPERPNLVRYDWTNGSAWVRTDALPLDPPAGAYAGNQVVQCTGRWEEDASGGGGGGGANGTASAAGFVVYAVNSARLLRVDTSARTVRVLATAPPGTWFYGVALAPFRSDVSPAPASVSRTPSPTPTRTRDPSASSSRSSSPSASGSRTGTPTGSPASGSASGTVAGLPSATGTPSGDGNGSGTPPAAASSAPPSASAAATSAAASTGTSSATGTPTGTASRPAVTGSPTPTRSGGSTPALTGSRSGSGTASLTGSPPPTGPPTPDASVTSSRSGTSSSTGTSSSSGTSSRSSTGSPTGTSSSSGTSSRSGTGSQSGTSSPSGTWSRSGTGSLSATATSTASSSGTPTPSGSTSGTPTGAATATATATGSPSRSETPPASRSSTQSGTGASTGTPAASASKTAVPAGSSRASRSRTASRTRTRTRTRTRPRTSTPRGSTSPSATRKAK